MAWDEYEKTGNASMLLALGLEPQSLGDDESGKYVCICGATKRKHECRSPINIVGKTPEQIAVIVKALQLPISRQAYDDSELSGVPVMGSKKESNIPLPSIPPATVVEVKASEVKAEQTIAPTQAPSPQVFPTVVAPAPVVTVEQKAQSNEERLERCLEDCHKAFAKQQEQMAKQMAEHLAAVQRQEKIRAENKVKQDAMLAEQAKLKALKQAERKAKNEALQAAQAAAKAAKQEAKNKVKRDVERPSRPAEQKRLQPAPALQEPVLESEERTDHSRVIWPVFRWNPEWDSAPWTMEFEKWDKFGKPYTVSYLNLTAGRLMWDSRWPETVKKLPPLSRPEPQLGPSLSELGVLPPRAVVPSGSANLNLP